MSVHKCKQHSQKLNQSHTSPSPYSTIPNHNPTLLHPLHITHLQVAAIMSFFTWRGFIALSSLLYMFLIIVTIPLAFDVGGEDCGIAFTGTLSLFYLILSTLRIMARNTKLKYLTSTLYHLQHIIIPSLLILHLSLFSTPTLTSKTNTFLPSLSVSRDPIFKLWLSLLGPWRWFVKNATPLFTTMEGFCTLLVIQTSGRLATWLVRKRSDSWIIPQLLFSSCAFSCSLYFLYQIYTFPVTISLVSATLIGAVLTVSAFLALYGIVSGRGNSVESSLLLSYIVYCLYFTFTDFQSSFSAETFLYFFSSSTRPDIPPLPPVIINGYTNLVSSIASLAPTAFKTVFQFLHGAVSTVTPSVFVSLSYRLSVFWAATRIIPAIHQVSVHALPRTQSLNSLSPSLSSSSQSPASSSSNNVPINSRENASSNTRLRQICSSQNISKNDSFKCFSSGNIIAIGNNTDAASTGIPNSADFSSEMETKNYILRQRRDIVQGKSLGVDENTDYSHASFLKPSYHSRTFSDESAIIDDSDVENDILASTVSAMSSSTTIASTPDFTVENGSGCNNRSSKNMNHTYSQLINDSSRSFNNFYEQGYSDNSVDDLKEKYIPYSFYDHYKNTHNDITTTSHDDDYDDSILMNDDFDSFNEPSTSHIDDQLEKELNDLKLHSDYLNSTNAHSTNYNYNNSCSTKDGYSLQFFILAYGPCILIAVYTHLLIQHLSIFNTISNQNSSDIRTKTGTNESNIISAATQTIASALASSSMGQVVSGSIAAYGASLSSISSVGKQVIETASANIAAALGSPSPSSSYLKTAASLLMGPERTTSPQELTWAATKILLIKNAMFGIWHWSRSWVSTPRDSWQFWGWINMFSTLALYAIELIYGKQGANEDIIEYHWKNY